MLTLSLGLNNRSYVMSMKLKTVFKDNLIFLIIAFIPYVSMPAIANSQQRNVPEVFTEPLNVLRGKLIPQSNLGEVWPEEFYCEIVKREWGWSSCGNLDAFIVGFSDDVDTLLIEQADTSGFVKFDDWDPSNIDDEIKAIKKELRAAVKVQGEKLGFPVRFEGWRAYPTLDKKTGVMYYATDISFDGSISTNIKASIFDRYGYSVFKIVPVRSDLNDPQITKIVSDVTGSYVPNPTSKREAFTSGDKVAAVGAVGVLATLIGVKYGKTAAAGAIAIAMIFLKKAWFLLLLPFYWLIGLFRKKS